MVLVRLLLPLLACASLLGPAVAASAPATAALGPNDVARLLAGLPPARPDPVLERLTALPEWQAHRQWMQARWADVSKRLDAMARWRDAELKPADAARTTLIYPFSGPDFLNAQAMFPTLGRYVFFSLERPGSLPDVARMGNAEFGRLLGDVRSAFSEIFERNYFITSYMTRQLTTPYVAGTVPVIAVMMALTGYRIDAIAPLDPFPELTREYTRSGATRNVTRPAKLLTGVRIDFTAPDGGARQLDYFSLDATDRALRWYPDFLAYVGRGQPAQGFLKSASYLLHDQQFAATRAMLIDRTDLVVQDDTGIPYRHLQGAGWNVRLYGTYAPPIKELRYGAQPDLEAAYKAAGRMASLEFPFGYHWKDGQSGLMVARRTR